MTSDNVHHLPNTAAAQALTLARAYQPDYLDRLLAEERRRLPAPTVDDAIDQIVTAGDAVRFTDEHWPGGILRGLLDRLAQVERERDQARGIAVALECRIELALDEARPHLGRLTVAGGLARNVESALDPHDDDEGDDAA